jgi:hypothetical protein
MTVYYSTDDETFNISVIWDVYYELEDQDRLNVGESYYEAEFEPITPSRYCTLSEVDHILETLDERVYDDCNMEDSESIFQDTTPEQKEELRKLLEDWTTKYVNLSKYYRCIGKSVQKQITQQDIDDHGS